MSDAVLFVLVFGGIFVLRGIAATIVFLWILPDGIRCPQCDAETMRIESGRLMRLLPRFRSSWCLACGWHGVHRISADDARGAARVSPQETSRTTSGTSPR